MAKPRRAKIAVPRAANQPNAASSDDRAPENQQTGPNPSATAAKQQQQENAPRPPKNPAVSRAVRRMPPQAHQQQHQQQTQRPSYQSQSKTFPPHYLKEVVDKGLVEKRLLVGTIRINPKRYEDAFIASPNPVHPDILIRGVRMRNRAFHGDEVVVDLLPKKEWLVLHDKVRDYMEGRSQDPDDLALQNRAHRVEDEGEEEKGEEVRVGRRAGKEERPVGNLVEKNSAAVRAQGGVTNGSELVVTEKQQQESAEALKVEAGPPKGEKEKEREEESGEQPPKAVAEQLVEELKKKKTRRGKRPVKKIQGEKDAEKSKTANGVEDTAKVEPSKPKIPFHKIRQAKDHVPTVQYQLDHVMRHPLWERFVQKTGRVVFILQEKHSRIAAGSLKLFGDRNPEFGFFAPTDSRIPRMRIPKKDCPDSFFQRPQDFQNMLFVAKVVKWDIVANADVTLTMLCLSRIWEMESTRLAFTLLMSPTSSRRTPSWIASPCPERPLSIWCRRSSPCYQDEKGNIELEWFGRTVIKSCCKLAYEHAQSMLEQPNKEWISGELPPISSPWTSADLSQRVNILQKVAVNLRRRRVESGALRLDLPKLCFSLDKATGEPQSYQLYEHRHSNKLIEEFMLLANMSVAKKITSAFPNQAVLRRHPPPKENMMEPLVQALTKLDFDIDFSTSKTLAMSLKKYEEKATDVHSRAKYQVLVNMISKPMDLAKYFCTGTVEKEEDYRHYALLLDAALKGSNVNFKIQELRDKADHCNDKNLNAKRAGDSSEELFLALFIKQCGPIDVRGVIIEVKDHSFDVLILEMATVKRVYFDPIGQSLLRPPRYVRSEGQGELKVEWKPEAEGEAKQTQHLRIFGQVELTLQESAKPFEFTAILCRPVRAPPQ
ncbi:unnamed protein product [Sphagnum tenellum]